MRTTFTTAIALAAALAAWSCYQDDTTGPGGREPFGAPFTTVEITDAPFPYDSVARVDLYIVSIQASPSPDTSDLNPDWVTIAEPHQAYNLIDLQGGVTDTLGGKIIPAGQYRAVRMVLDTDSSSITAKNGQPMPVAWQSSAGRPTLYAYVEDPLGVADTGAQIVIDFDVGRSFLCDAPCSSFVFSPVFRAPLRAGADLLVHGVTDRPVDDEFLALARERHAIYTPTLTVFDGYRQVRVRHFEPHYPLDCVDSATVTRARMTDLMPPAPGAPADHVERQTQLAATRLSQGQANLLAVFRAGITVAMRTDAGNPLTLHGPSVYWEMEAMQQAGLPPAEVLVAATRNGAIAMNRERDLGTVETGKIADLVVLGSDPIADTRALRDVRYVMRAGALTVPRLSAPR